MIQNIVFYNHWHLGDLFTTRQWVKDIIQQTPECTHVYAHAHSEKLTRDLCEYANQSHQLLNDLPHNTQGVHQESTHTLYVNTWVGTYRAHFDRHPTYLEHQQIVKSCYQEMCKFGNMLTWKSDAWSYVPQVDYSLYNLDKAQRLITSYTQDKILICNNDVKSGQSDVGDMANVIQALATHYPDKLFLVTKRLDILLPNVLYTSDVFHMHNDLIEISWISQYCKLIVGKNSGAFTYTNTRENLRNPHIKMICLSQRHMDTLPHGLDHECKFVWADWVSDHEIYALIEQDLATH